MPSLAQLLGRGMARLPGGSALLHAAAGVADPAAAPIFMLHRVLPDPGEAYDPEMVVSLAAFSAFLDWVAQHYEVVDLDQLLPRLAQPRPPAARPLCALTFDDGWRDTFTHAFPQLQARHLPATVFLPLAFIGTGRRFWQERLARGLLQLRSSPDALQRLQAVAEETPWCPQLEAADLDFGRLRARLVRRSSPEAEAFVQRLIGAAETLPDDGRAFMHWDEVRALQAAGIRFGSHTLNHTLLSWAAPKDAEDEVRRSRSELERQLGTPVRTFSYPWGGISPFTPAQVRDAGYVCAVTTRPALVRPGADPWRLPRVPLSDAQLGFLRNEPAWRPSTLQVHLARARRQPSPPAAPRPDRARLRIGFLVDNPETWGEPPQEHLGGSELQLLHLINALNPDYFQPELYFLRPPASGLPTRLPWPVFGSPAGSTGRIATIRRLRQLLRRERPDLVQSMFVDSTFLGVPAAWLAGVPAILCARRNAGYWKRWFHRAALHVINRMANAWQVNARQIADMLEREEHVPAAAIEIVSNWIDLDRFQPPTPADRLAARRRLQLPEDAFIAVSVANYSPVKDLGALVEAAGLALAELPQLRVLLIGDGPERDPLEGAIAAHRLQPQVRLTGGSDQVELYLAAADVGVLTSRSEGCSNAVLEYMAAGLPTVLSDIPANRVLSADGLFPVGDAARLAAELLRLARNPAERVARGHRNRRRAELYGGEAFATRIQGHYLRAAAIRRLAG